MSALAVGIFRIADHATEPVDTRFLVPDLVNFLEPDFWTIIRTVFART